MRPLNDSQMQALRFVVAHGETLLEDLMSHIKDTRGTARGLLRCLISRGLARNMTRKGILGPRAKWKQHLGRYSVYYPTEEGTELCQTSRPASRSASSNP